MSIAILRRKLLSHGSMMGTVNGTNPSEGVATYLSNLGTDVNVIRNDGRNYAKLRKFSHKPLNPNVTLTNADYVVRYGCISTVDNIRVINTSRAIKLVNNKLEFRKILNDHPTLGLRAIHSDMTQELLESEQDQYPMVLRKRNHAQGRHLWVVNDLDDLYRHIDQHNLHDGWYATKLIQKTAEYRVMVMQGRVLWVAKKTPGNPDDVAWNVSQGGRFDTVRFNDWNLQVVRKAVEAFKLTGLDFGGVDMMVDEQDQSWVIEINSAPSQTSPYRQECFAKGLNYIDNNGKAVIELIGERGGYRKFIHPAITDRAILTGDHNE